MPILARIDRTTRRDQVFTLHAELEGGAYLPHFERLLRAWREAGFEFRTLGDAARHADRNSLRTSRIEIGHRRRPLRNTGDPGVGDEIGILQRYLLRALALNWVVLFFGLMLIMTIAQVPTILGRAAEHEVAPHLVFEVLMLMVVANMPIVILLTLLLAIVVTIGRLSHDSELTAMRAAGFSPLNLLAVVAIFSVPLVGLLAAMTHDFAPRAFCEAVLARADAARNILTRAHASWRLRAAGSAWNTFRQQVAPDGEMLHVFVSFDQAGAIGRAHGGARPHPRRSGRECLSPRALRRRVPRGNSGRATFSHRALPGTDAADHLSARNACVRAARYPLDHGAVGINSGE